MRKRGFAYSKDGGDSWSDIQYDSRLPESSCQGSAIRLTGDQTHPGESRILIVNPANIYGRIQLTVRMSYDETKNWPVSKIIHEGSAAYSDLAVSQNGEILCLYEADDYTKLVIARFNVEWLTDGSDSPA